MINGINNYNSNLAFGAGFRQNSFILKDIGNGLRDMQKVKIVEFNPRKYTDILALQKISRIWGEYFNPAIPDFSHQIAEDARLIYNGKGIGEGTCRILGLTTQKTSISKVYPDKMLGLAELKTFDGVDNKPDCLVWLQTKPANVNMADGQGKYIHIGKALLKFIREFSGKDIESAVTKSSIPFYKKQVGIVQLNERAVLLKNINNYKKPKSVNIKLTEKPL